MDRRKFAKLSLGTVAAAAGGTTVLAPTAAQETSLPRGIAQLPADLRSLLSMGLGLPPYWPIGGF